MKNNNLISVKTKIWDEIKNKMQKIQLEMNSINIYGKVEMIRYQGSVATKTIINPVISKGKNDIDLDVAIVIKHNNKENYLSQIINECKEALKEAFKEYEIKKEEKAFGISFPTFTIDGEQIKLSLDFVILFKIENETYVFNHKTNALEYSDPFSMINKFNEKVTEEERYNVKIIKSLISAHSIKAIKSIFIINSAIKLILKNETINLKNLSFQLKEDMKEINENGYIYSATNNKDKLNKKTSENLDINEIIIFLNKISSWNDEQIKEVIEMAIEGKNSKINLENPEKIIIPVHGKK